MPLKGAFPPAQNTRAVNPSVVPARLASMLRPEDFDSATAASRQLDVFFDFVPVSLNQASVEEETRSGTWLINVPGPRWSYAASWQKSSSAPESGMVVQICAEIAGAAVGFGCVGPDHSIYVGSEVEAKPAIGQQTLTITVENASEVGQLILRNVDPTGQSATVRVLSLSCYIAAHGPTLSSSDFEKFDLHALTTAPFVPKAERSLPFVFGSVTVSEACNLECVFCHFNGPLASKTTKTLEPALVRKVMDQLAPGTIFQLSATGEYFMNPNAVHYIEYAVSRGLVPDVLSNGTLFTPELLDRVLKAGLRLFRISCDSIDPSEFAKIRRGGNLQTLVDAITYLRARKPEYPDIRVYVQCTLLSTTEKKRDDMIRFWADKADSVLFNAEYYDTFRFRNIRYKPTKRVDCTLQTYITPSGKIAPCCAMVVWEHNNDASFLPDVRTHSLEEAYKALCEMYEDPKSKLSSLCKGCDWWIMWAKERQDKTPYFEMHAL